MSIKFDSKEVKKFFNETCKLGGNKNTIDTKKECDKLSAYLAANQDNMSTGDIATFNTYIKANEKEQPTQQAQGQDGNADVNVKGNNNTVQAGQKNTLVNGDINVGGNGQVVIGGNGNQQNMDTGNTPAKPPVQKETPVKSKPKPKPQPPVQSGGDGSTVAPKDEYKYSVTIRTCAGDKLSLESDAQDFKASVIAQIKSFRIANGNEIIQGLASKNTVGEIQDYLNSQGIGLVLAKK